MNKSVMLFIPAYRCEKQIVRVLNSLNNEEISSLFVEIVVIENISPDNTLNVSIEKAKQLSNLNITVIQNDENYSLGGSHKVAFNYFLEKGYDYLVVLHGDDQGDIKDIVPIEYYEPLEHCLGSLEQVMSKGWSRTESAPIF